MAWHTVTTERRRAAVSTLSLLWASVGALMVSVGLFWIAIAATTTPRLRAAERLSSDAISLLGEARDLYIVLGDADATASRELLLERTSDVADDRARYEQDLHQAGTLITAIANDAGGSRQIMSGIEGIATRLPEYAANVDESRANSRQGFSVTTAYLRDASDLMQHEILAAATSIYVEAMDRMDDEGKAATSRDHVTIIVLAGALALSVLVVVQILVAVRTRRTLNPGLVVATLAVVTMLAVTLGQFAAAQSGLSDAQRDGQNAMQTLSVAQMLTLRAQRADAAQLIERATDDETFAGLAERIGGTQGLIGASGDSGRMQQYFQRFVAAHALVATSDGDGDHPGAVRLFRTAELTQADELTTELRSAVSAAEGDFVRHATDAIGEMRWLTAAMGVVALVAVAAGSLGLAGRIKEYR